MRHYRYFNRYHASSWEHRKGFTVLEAFISMILVSTTVVIAMPALKVVNLQRKSSDERLSAITTLANLGEKISAETSWKSLTSDKLNQYQADIIHQLNLKEPELKIELVERESDPTFRQVRMHLSWLNPHGQMVDPIVLSLWFHRESSNHD